MNRRHLLRHRLISALLTAVLVLGLMPVSVFAEQVPPVTAPDVSTQPQSPDASEAGFTIWTEPVFASTFDPAQEPLIASYANSVYTGSYRDQLSELEQAAYDYVVSNPVITTAESQKNPVKLSVQAQAVLIAGSDGKPTIDYQNVPEYRALIESLQKAAYAVCYDYPMYSWILNGAFSAGVLVSYPGGSQIGDTITITFTGAYYNFKKPSYYDQISSVDQKIAEIVAKVDKSAPQKDQLKTLHDEVCRLTDYNYEAVKQNPSLNGDWLYAWSPYGTFTGQKVVCEGYARAFKMLCDALSIPCALISGSGNGEAHMWNAVQMEDGKWYGVDVTWDDGGAISYTYFLKPSADFTDHIPQPHLQLVYPVLSDTEYVGQKPTLSVTSNASDWTKEDVTLVVKVANFASGVQCFYQLPSASEQAVSLDASGNGKVTVSQEMNGNVVFTLKDSGGNQLGSQQVAVKIDRTNPVISNVTLTDTGTPLSARIATKNQVRVSATVTDSASGVKTVQAAVGSDVYPMEKSGDTYSVVIDREYAAQTVKVTAQDAVGNTAENSAGESVTTDKTPPSIAQLSVKEGSVSANAATISAALGENAALYYLVQPASQAAPDAQAILTGGQSAGVGTNAVELSVDGLAPNTAYVVYAVAQDAVGNVCGVTTVSFQTQKEALRFTGSLTAKGTYGVTWNELNITASADVTTQDGSVVSGTWRWTNAPADLPETTIQQASATFVPDKNAENYNTLTADAAITIAKAQADQGMKTANGLIVAGVPGSAVLPALPKGASYGAPATTDSQVLKPAVNGTQLTYEGSADVAEGTSYTVTVPVTGAVNYEDYTITVTLLGTSKKVPSGQPALSADTLTYGEPLSTITLTGTLTSEGAQVPGSFAWETPDAMPSAGTFQANWIFTPENTNLYEQVKGTASIEVARKELTVRVASVEEKVFDGTTTAKGTLTLEGAVKGCLQFHKHHLYSLENCGSRAKSVRRPSAAVFF